jgi:aryl-alcohol dehydrogenase-like predicted oxidoreductase
MSLFNRIAIGTANWGKKYRGVQVPQKDKERILEVAYDWGIDTIDTAVAYDNDVYELTKNNRSYWKIVLKIDSVLSYPIWILRNCLKPYAVLSHGYPDSAMIGYLYSLTVRSDIKMGVSIYSDELTIPRVDTLQIPYNPYDKRSIDYVEDIEKGGMELHVRSVFCAGKALKDFTVQQCIAFPLMNPKIDKVILGFDSFDQFQENLEWIHKLETSWSNNPDVYDTRRF